MFVVNSPMEEEASGIDLLTTFYTSIEEGSQAVLDAVGDVERERLDRPRRVHTGRSHKDAAVDDEQVFHVMAATPLVHDRTHWIDAHPRSSHQVPSALDDRGLVPHVVRPGSAQDLGGSRNCRIPPRRGSLTASLIPAVWSASA